MRTKRQFTEAVPKAAFGARDTNLWFCRCQGRIHMPDINFISSSPGGSQIVSM